MESASRRPIALLIAVALALLPGCASSRVASSDPSSAESQEVYGPTSAPPVESYGPQPVRKDAIVLVLGPGMARGLAHAGVLKGLRDARIPIAAIIGTEMGALMGSLYSLSESNNKFDWALLQFKSEAFLPSRGILSAFGDGLSNGRALESALTETLRTRTFEQGRVPVGVVVALENTSASTLIDRGRAAPALRAALASPGLMEPQPRGKDRLVSAAGVRPYPVSEARLLSSGHVVVVDVLGNGDGPGSTEQGEARERLRRIYAGAREVGERDLAGAAWVIRPQLEDIDYLDFKKRTEIVYRGKRAVQRDLSRLRAMIDGTGNATGVEQ